MAELAFDLGQTQTRVRITSDSGATSELELDGFRYGSNLMDTIAERCTRAANTLGNQRVHVVAGGVTGLYGHAPDLSGLLATLSTSLGARRVVIADDAVTSHLGALAGEPGTLVAAGTGLVGLGVGPAGAARVDGVGSVIGDNGSGWWIGREGIIAALSTKDGRSGASAALLDALENQLGPIEAVPAKIAASPFPVGMVASFAPAVAAAAREGDVRSREIWVEAARHIADAVVAASTRAGFTRDASFSWAVAGRLTGAGDLLDPVLNSIVAARFPEASRVTPSGTSLDGAQQLLRHPDPMTLAPLVGVCVTEKETDD
ncbi:BadF/BadG/BcrA/BcrD ATPase family protein [Microbacterium sp. X-17]|uniref:BadF/BadG/BcrA/BcrD ATPase family protein n=1 Tax=Microbacterium sp. X-17 TaxID=3144404 RepID=UPI0031F589D3